MAVTFTCITLRGGDVAPRIDMTAVCGRSVIQFTPFSDRDQALGVCTVDAPAIAWAHVAMVDVGGKSPMPVLAPAAPTAPAAPKPAAELVLVQQYQNGCGRKRYPGFLVALDNVQILAEAYTTGGTGSEPWSLVIAPLGWARGIARQWDGERDAPTVSLAWDPSSAPAPDPVPDPAPDPAPAPDPDPVPDPAPDPVPDPAPAPALSAFALALAKALS